MQHKNVPSAVVYMLLIPISLPGTDMNGGAWLCYEVKCLPPNSDHAHNKHNSTLIRKFQSSTVYHSLMMDPM